MRSKCRRFCCMNNNYFTTNIQNKCNYQELIEDTCNNIGNNQNYNENCGCGCTGLKNGTIFPELVSPYMPGDSMKQIKYLEKTNIIGKGCNQCQ